MSARSVRKWIRRDQLRVTKECNFNPEGAKLFLLTDEDYQDIIFDMFFYLRINKVYRLLLELKSAMEIGKYEDFGRVLNG